MAPWADIHYSNDHDWWERYIDECREVGDAELWTGHPTATRLLNLKTIPYRRDGRGLNLDPKYINWGGNSGFAAIQLAFKTNPKWIGLLGYDMGDPSGQGHWHRDHPEDVRKAFNFPMWVPRFNEMAADLKKIGLPVINFTRQTSLTCFDRASLEDYL